MTLDLEPCDDTQVFEEKQEAKKEYNVGDVVQFNGGTHYVSSYSDAKGYKASAGPAKITIKNGSGKAHPWHLIHTDGTSNVYGWVDEGTFSYGLGGLAYKSEVGTSDLATELADTISAKAANSTVNTLIGSDTGKSVREIANEELAAQLIPANAKDSLDTLQEIAAWIQDHPDEAAAINAKLTLGKHDVDGQQVEYNTVKAYVEAMTSGLIKLDALSATVTGDGNAVTAASYNSATGVLTLTKGATFAQTSQIATDAEVTEMLTEIFGAAS